jgi:adenosylhomocysteine nucleosidase
VSEVQIDDPCVVFALGREAAPFLRAFRLQQRFPGAPCPAHFCGPTWLTVLVLQSGIGATRMRQAVDWLVGNPVLGNLAYRPKVVIAAGYAGALDESLAVGDTLVASEVVDTEGDRWPVTWPEKLEGEWRPPLHRGRLLTATKLVGRTDDKRELGRRFAAVAVDMESAVLARECSHWGIPFGCVRAISDDVRTPLSERLLTLLSNNQVSPWRTVGAVVRTPALVGELTRLARQTRLASRQLGKALGELLTLTLPWSDELDSR